MKIQEVYTNGFSFSKLKISETLLEKIYNLEFTLENVEKNDNAQATLGECKLPMFGDIAVELRAILCESTDDPTLKEIFLSMGFMASKFSQGDFINLHKDHRKHKNSDFHLNIWLPRSHYVGRDFVFGTKDETSRIHPELGDAVIISNCPDKFIHGVTPFIEGEPNISINGYYMLPEFQDIDELNMSCRYFGTTEDLLRGSIK